jgi:CO/xanthine dehydrogenase Mo-binding subunit
MPYDAEGQLLAATLMDYALPQSDQAPSVEAVLLEVPSEHGPFGAKGVGEPSIIVTAPAVANAIRHATGASVTRLPMTPEAVHRAIAGWG